MKINNKNVIYEDGQYYYFIKNKKYNVTNLVNRINEKYKTTNVNFIYKGFDSKLENKINGGS